MEDILGVILFALCAIGFLLYFVIIPIGSAIGTHGIKGALKRLFLLILLGGIVTYVLCIFGVFGLIVAIFIDIWLLFNIMCG